MQAFKLLINGELVDGDLTMPVINPATEKSIADCPRASERQLRAAVAAAKAAFPAWAAQPMSERRAIVTGIADVIDANREELAQLLTAEQGKPLPDARNEVMAMAGYYRHFASLDLPPKVLEDSGNRRVEMHRRPLGVVAAITPWNYPLSISALKLPPALVAGNTVVLKPAATTPLSTLRFAELVADRLPKGVLNVITDANDLGALLTTHPDVRKVSFTGSTATGKRVMESGAATLKRMTLELGGNDAAIVLDDVDPKAVAPRVFQAAFQNSGQVCFAIKRLYVHESVYDEMCGELAHLAKAAVVDDGTKPGAKFGPLQNKAQFERVKSLIAEAREHGTVIAGGAAIDRPGFFVQPTIVRDIQEGSRLVDEEQFGPVLPVIRFVGTEEVIRRVNDTAYGLGVSVWSSDPGRALALASRLEAGTVWVNKHLDLPAHIPVSGAKQSGVGVEKDLEGLAEFTQIQIVNV